MAKTLLRSMKRYVTDLFESIVVQKMLNKSEIQDKFLECVEEVIDSQLQGLDFYVEQFSVKREDLFWFVGMLVEAHTFKLVAKKSKADQALEDYKLFQSVVYQFSKPKL